MKTKEKLEKLKISEFFNEFKTFISRGNVMDLAVGMIIGAAFTAIVNSLVNDVVTPLLGIIIGGIDFSGLVITIPGIFEGHSVTIAFGNFIQSIISFLAIAFCVFIMIRTLNNLRDKMIKKEEEAKEEETADESTPDPNILLLTEIRDLLSEK